MKRWIKSVRDNRIVLPVCVAALRGLRSMGLARSRTVYSHVPYRGTVTVNCPNGRHFRMQSRGHNIENGLYWDGLFAHEPESMRHWTERASSAEVVLDIGANSGVFALAAAAAGARRVHAFEPLPRVHRILLENIRLNEYAGLRAWPYAAGSEQGTAAIFDPGGDAPTSASLSHEFASGKLQTTKKLQVPVVCIDSFCEEQGIETLDLVKIDVEGYEERVLRGMQTIVARSSPDILIEVLAGQDTAVRQVVEDLWPETYQWTRIDEGPQHVSRNVMLTPLQ